MKNQRKIALNSVEKDFLINPISGNCVRVLRVCVCAYVVRALLCLIRHEIEKRIGVRSRLSSQLKFNFNPECRYK